MTAEERGMNLMLVPLKDLPPLAFAFAKALVQEVGLCSETFLTAYIVYAQLVEGLVCEDDLYKSRLKDILWFQEHMKGP